MGYFHFIHWIILFPVSEMSSFPMPNQVLSFLILEIRSHNFLDIFLMTCGCLVSVVISIVGNPSYSRIRLISSRKISKLQAEVKQIKGIIKLVTRLLISSPGNFYNYIIPPSSQEATACSKYERLYYKLTQAKRKSELLFSFIYWFPLKLYSELGLFNLIN